MIVHYTHCQEDDRVELILCVRVRVRVYVLDPGEFPSEIHLWVDRYDAEKDIPSAPAERSEVSAVSVLCWLTHYSFIHSCDLLLVVVAQSISGEGAPPAGILLLGSERQDG